VGSHVIPYTYHGLIQRLGLAKGPFELLIMFTMRVRLHNRRFVPRIQPSSSTQVRRLHLAPPFLLDDYIPKYHLLSSVDAAKKRSAAYAHLSNCNLCPRLCGVNRYEKTGVCLIGAETVKVNVIAPHFGEGK
jgi:putative pyruvate formate lyase activating enzyme